jgi:hypothetical protein
MGPLAALGFGVGVAGILLLGGGEIIARVSGARPQEAVPSPHPFAEEHSVLGWVNRPGSVPSREPGHALMTFWADGRRASRLDPTANGRVQVVLVGGSFTQGYGVRDEQTFAWQLDEAFPDLAIENYGTGGYGTYQSLLRLEQLFATQAAAPGLVIYGFVSHHAHRNVQTSAWLEALRRSVSGWRIVPPHVVVRDGALHRQPSALVRDWPLEQKSAQVHAWHVGWDRWALRDREAQSVPATIALLLEMNELVRRSGSRLLVAILHGGRSRRIFESTSLAGRVTSVNCNHSKGAFQPENRVGGVGHPNHTVHAYWAGCIERWLDAHRPGRGSR